VTLPGLLRLQTFPNSFGHAKGLYFGEKVAFLDKNRPFGAEKGAKNGVLGYQSVNMLKLQVVYS
jgi:hypothetical protein